MTLLRAIVIILLGLSLSGGSVALAKVTPYKAGLLHYTRGEFQDSVLQLQKALASGRISRDEKMNAHKFLGLSLFTLGRLDEAEQNFVKCLTLDRNCSIRADEALDESVIPFFKSVKERLENPSPTPRSPIAAITATPSAPQAAAPSPPLVTSSSSGTGTRIVVQSNVKNAQILMDGILAGPVGTTLSAAPGTIEIEVQAPGYINRRLKLPVKRDLLNTFQVDLVPEGPSREELAASKLSKDKARMKADAQARDKARADALARERKTPRSREESALRDEELKKAPPVLPRENQTPLDMDEESDALFSEEARRGRRRDSEFDFPPTRAESAAQTKEKIPLSIFHLLPAGIGQIYNEDYFIGFGFFAIQAYSLYAILEAQENMQRSADNLTTAYTRNDLTTEQLEAYTVQINAYNTAQKGAQDRAILFLGVSYAVGVVHAVLMRPEQTPKAPPGGFSWEWEPQFTPQGDLRLVMDWQF